MRTIITAIVAKRHEKSTGKDEKVSLLSRRSRIGIIIGSVVVYMNENAMLSSDAKIRGYSTLKKSITVSTDK